MLYADTVAHLADMSLSQQGYQRRGRLRNTIAGPCRVKRSRADVSGVSPAITDQIQRSH
jgi:hypothetical protein